MHVYVRVRTCVRTCSVCARTCTHMYSVCMCTYVYAHAVCVYVCVRTCTVCACVRTCTHMQCVCTYVYVHMYSVCVCTHMCTCTYICRGSSCSVCMCTYVHMYTCVCSTFCVCIILCKCLTGFSDLIGSSWSDRLHHTAAVPAHTGTSISIMMGIDRSQRCITTGPLTRSLATQGYRQCFQGTTLNPSHPTSTSRTPQMPPRGNPGYDPLYCIHTSLLHERSSCMLHVHV